MKIEKVIYLKYKEINYRKNESGVLGCDSPLITVIHPCTTLLLKAFELCYCLSAGESSVLRPKNFLYHTSYNQFHDMCSTGAFCLGNSLKKYIL